MKHFDLEFENSLKMAEKRAYLSDIIPSSEMQLWNNKNLVVIQAPTGCGKSTLIQTTLYDLAKTQSKKILILVNREKLKKEFETDIINNKKEDVIDVMTYQTLEAYTKNHGTQYDLSEYDYVISDESHYFHNDSLFNKYTQESFDNIINSNSVKVFMSATNKSLINYLDYYEYDYKLYSLDTDYSYANITFFNKKLYIYDLLRSLKEEGEKAIIFMQDIMLAYEIYDMFKDDSLFLCSKSNKQYYRYVNEDKINNMLENKKFDCLFLITTTVFENGNNIKDENLHHMIIQLSDLDSIQQCIGRKRIECSDDYLNIAICNLNNQALGGLLTKNKEVVRGAELLIRLGERAYVSRYSKDYDPCVYDIYNDAEKRVEKRINSFRYFKCKNNIKMYSKWLADEDKMGFKKDVIKLFGKEWEGGIYCFNEDEVRGRQTLNEYIESIKGKDLLKDEQRDLIKKIGLKDSRGRLIKSIKFLNSYLLEEEYKYKIESKRKKKDGKKITIWIVKEIKEGDKNVE